ncbi:MAG: hypothetical protein IJ268_12385 [Proteobacteria bacterium]|nr:hypothetical protein [Pseudomonadota bacterium]
MKQCRSLVLSLFLGVFLCIPVTAFAGHFTLDIAGGWTTENAPLGPRYDRRDLHGAMFTISPEYRFHDYVGLALDLDLGAMGMEYQTYILGQPSTITLSQWFYGGSYLSVAGYYAPGGPVELFLKLGLGAQYLAWEQFDHKIHAWFAVKAGVGATYKLTRLLGIGIITNYIYGYGDVNEEQFENRPHHHTVDIQFHLRFDFK